MALYMKYADIEGSATSSAHDKWIPLSSCQWGGGRGITTHVGAAKNREASHAQISEMVVTKSKDNSSRPLYQRSLTKPVGESVTVHIATTSQGNANVWTSAGDGVHCHASDGTLLGKIRVPEAVANLCFGGPKLNRLFICATTSLYSVYLNTRAAVRPA